MISKQMNRSFGTKKKFLIRKKVQNETLDQQFLILLSALCFATELARHFNFETAKIIWS
jgi:hypothetical protein